MYAMRELQHITEPIDSDSFKLCKQTIKWGELDNDKYYIYTIHPGDLSDGAYTILRDNKSLQSTLWRNLYYGFADFARYVCMQGDFSALAEKFHSDWTFQLNMIFQASYIGERTHLLALVKTQILSEISGYYTHKMYQDKDIFEQKEFMYVFQKQERTRLHFLQQFLEYSRRGSIRTHAADTYLR